MARKHRCPVCPCCREVIEGYDDAPYCWDCGLYERDSISRCDNERHPHRTIKTVLLDRLGIRRLVA